MTLPLNPKGKFIIHQDENTIYTPDTSSIPRSVSRSSIPLAARTRSMTRLSAHTSENKLATIHRRLGATAGKENAKAGLGGPGSRRPLGERMMNVQRGLDGRDGLKRKAEMDDTGLIKRPRVDQMLPQYRDDRETTEPSTPPRRMDRLTARPTPAREILAAEAMNLGDADEKDNEEEESPEMPNRFIARPPTPPRPHMQLAPDVPVVPVGRTPSPNKMDIDSPVRQTHIEQRDSHRSRAEGHNVIARPPTTPRTTIPTPRRVMGSISKFRAGPSSVKRPVLSPLKATQESTGPILAELLAASGTKELDLVPGDNSKGLEISKDAQRDVDMADYHLGNDQVEVVDPSLSTGTLRDLTTHVERAIPGADAAAKQASAVVLPSRIPRPSSMLAPRVTASSTNEADTSKKSSIPVLSKSAASTMTLGRGLPKAASSKTTLTSATEGGSSDPIRRKPSYPASLGSGPLARPRDRMVSGPTLYRQQDGTLGAQKVEPTIPQGRPSPRSVSEPVPRSKSSLSASTTRREGLSLETSKSIAGLSDALNKLKVKRPEVKSEPNRPKPSTSRLGMGAPSEVAASSGALVADAPKVVESATTTLSRVSSVHRPRQSELPSANSPDSSTTSDEEHAGDKSLAAIMSSTSGEGCFRGVVAYIDVKTSDGEDAGPIFAAMIKALGGRVLNRPNNVTHVIYKSGRPSTLSFYRRLKEDKRPHIVGISWVTRSKEKGERLDEAPFVIDIAEEDVFQKRRKSMEPKALMQSTLPRPSLHDTSLNIASLKRKSMMYAPKISSPLKKTFRTMDEDE